MFGNRHTHFHFHGASDSILRKILNQLKKMSTKQEALDAAVASLTASSANISADLTALKDQIAAGTVTDESVTKLTELAAAFQTIADSTPDAAQEQA